MPSKSNPIISSHRDAATRVFTYLNVDHGIKLKPIVALEIVARVLGANNWQTLKAMAEQGRAPRPGDGVWFSGNPEDLPPVGGTSFTEALHAAEQIPLQPIFRKGLDQVLVFTDGEVPHEKLDLRFDQSDVQSMKPPTIRDNLWYALARRATEHKSSTLPDIDPLLDWVQHDELKVVLTPTQRAVVSHALHSPVSIASGYPDSGKALIAEAIVRIGRLAGLKNIVNARKRDAMPVDGGVFIAPEYRDKEVGSAFNSLSVEHLEPYLAGSELLIIDEHVTGNKYLFWDVVRAAPANCRIVILGQIPMDDGSEMSRMFKDLVARDFAKFTQLHEALRQQQLHFVSPAQLESELRGASHQPDYAIGPVRVVSNPRGYARDVPGQAAEDALKAEPGALVIKSSTHPTNAANYERKFLPDVRPSRSWHIKGHLYSPNARSFVSNELTGKWCINCDAETVDELWHKICGEIRTYRLFTALVSSASQARAFGGSHIICVFTPDWADEEDVMRARQVLRELGVTQEIGYKRDVETFNGVYGTPAEWFYRA